MTLNLPTDQRFTIIASPDKWVAPHVGVHATSCYHVDQRRREGFVVIPGLHPTTVEIVCSALVREYCLGSEDVCVMDCARGW